MVWFTFSFLLGTVNQFDPNDDKKDKKKQEQTEDPEKYCKQIEINKPSFFCHIEYVLMPNRPAESVDVVCWGDVAKIYFEGHERSIKTFHLNDLCWIHFRIRHRFLIQDVSQFHGHYVTVTVKLDKKKMGFKAKSDKPKMFYGHTMEKQLFPELCESLESQEDFTRKAHNISLETHAEGGEHAATITRLVFQLSNEYHDEYHVRVPTEPDLEALPPFILMKESSEAAIKKIEDKSKKEVKGKMLQTGIQYRISGEVFLSGRKQLTNCVKYNEEQLPFLCIVVSAGGFLSKEQAEEYNPFSVRLGRLKHMPCAPLKALGVSAIRLQYEVCDQIIVESNPAPVSDCITLDCTRTVLIDKIDRSAFLHFLQTQGLKVKIYGEISSSMSSLEFAAGFQKKLQASLGKKILLGIAKIDISSLLRQPHRVHGKYNVLTPVAEIIENHQSENYFQTMTNINQINMHYTVERKAEFCHFIITSGAVLTVSARMGCPLTNALRSIVSAANLFNRLFLLVFDIKDIRC